LFFASSPVERLTSWKLEDDTVLRDLTDRSEDAPLRDVAMLLRAVLMALSVPVTLPASVELSLHALAPSFIAAISCSLRTEDKLALRAEGREEAEDARECALRADERAVRDDDKELLDDKLRAEFVVLAAELVATEEDMHEDISMRAESTGISPTSE